jgi:lipoprotein-releasing system ATP-binding protein
MSKMSLELKNIFKSYKQGIDKIDVIKDFSLQLNQGEIVVITGASGSGKSTLLHIAGLLDRPDSGDVIISGKKVLQSDYQRTNIRLENLGFVYQYHHLLKDFSARENVAIPRLIAGKNYHKALEDADSILDRLGLGERKLHMPGELSGGQQQRVAIARAMINNPQIILADEPTGNLDQDSAKLTLDLMVSIIKERNISAIIVTHNNSVASVADKIYNMG